MRKKTKHYFRFIVIIFAILCWFSLDAPAVYGAYEALETNYRNIFNPATLPGYPETGTYLLQTIVKRPRKNFFRLYLPPGATRVNFRLCAEQDAKIGAVVRMGLYPKCEYNIFANKYYDLPWGPYNGTSVVALDGQDFQARNMGGQIVILSSATTPANHIGEWIYVKILKYESKNISLVQFEVTIDAAKYKIWYNGYTGWSAEWDAQGNPFQLFSGKEGGYCDPVWKEGEVGSDGRDGRDGVGNYDNCLLPTILNKLRKR